MAAFGDASMALVEGGARFADFVSFRRRFAGRSLVALAGAEHLVDLLEVSRIDVTGCD